MQRTIIQTSKRKERDVETEGVVVNVRRTLTLRDDDLEQVESHREEQGFDKHAHAIWI